MPNRTRHSTNPSTLAERIYFVLPPPQDIPELDGALSEPPPAETENAENNESKEISDNPPEVTVGEQEENANPDDETPTGLEEGGEEKASLGQADGEEEARHTQNVFSAETVLQS